uniref:Uncharacterized protein n=1 Tax=Pinguiococcus pyrenoidosus TaxID=172671 RepID=A0A7R9YE00_9STRA
MTDSADAKVLTSSLVCMALGLFRALWRRILSPSFLIELLWSEGNFDLRWLSRILPTGVVVALLGVAALAWSKSAALTQGLAFVVVLSWASLNVYACDYDPSWSPKVPEVDSRSCSEEMQGCRGGDVLQGPAADLYVFAMDTLAVVVRGFCLGFGAKISHLLWQEDFSKLDTEKLRNQVKGCMCLGMATACLLLGLSHFIPYSVRQMWMGSRGFD